MDINGFLIDSKTYFQFVFFFDESFDGKETKGILKIIREKFCTAMPSATTCQV